MRKGRRRTVHRREYGRSVGLLDEAVRDATPHFGRFDTEATVDNLARELRQIIASYGLDKRVASFTVDNGQNVLMRSNYWALNRCGVRRTC